MKVQKQNLPQLQANLEKRCYPGSMGLAFRSGFGTVTVAGLLGGCGYFLLPHLTEGRISRLPVALSTAGFELFYVWYSIHSANQRLRQEPTRILAVELINRDLKLDDLPEGIRGEIDQAAAAARQSIDQLLSAPSIIGSDLPQAGQPGEIKNYRLALLRLYGEPALSKLYEHLSREQASLAALSKGMTVAAILRENPEEGTLSGSFVNQLFLFYQGHNFHLWQGQIPANERLPTDVVITARELLFHFYTSLSELSWSGKPLELPPDSAQKIPQALRTHIPAALALLGRGKASISGFEYDSWLKTTALSVIKEEQQLTDLPEGVRGQVTEKIERFFSDVSRLLPHALHLHPTSAPLTGDLAKRWRLALPEKNIGDRYTFFDTISADRVRAHYPNVNLSFTAAEVDFILNDASGRGELFVVEDRNYDAQEIVAFWKNGGALPTGIRQLQPLPNDSSAHQQIRRFLPIDTRFFFPFSLFDLGDGVVRLVSRNGGAIRSIETFQGEQLIEGRYYRDNIVLTRRNGGLQVIDITASLPPKALPASEVKGGNGQRSFYDQEGESLQESDIQGGEIRATRQAAKLRAPRSIWD